MVQFGDQVDLGIIQHDEIDEASGIVSSRKNSNVLWTHNDSGDENRLFAFDDQGRHLGIYYIEGSDPRDWEDLAIGPGPMADISYLYIGNIGDNMLRDEVKTICRVIEPDVTVGQDTLTAHVNGAETISIRYPDKIRDAEALMIDPLTKDLFIVTKDSAQAIVFRAAYPQSTTETIEMEAVATLPIGLVVGCDISPDGLEILIKSYFAIYYWKRTPNEPLWQVFENPPLQLPYSFEPQGEAICWRADGMGYYTLSEEFFGLPCHLYFYPRLETSPVEDRSEKQYGCLLYQNYPNPFNAGTAVSYQLTGVSFVSLSIFNSLGQKVRTWDQEEKSAGRYSVIWDGRDNSGNTVQSGVYFYLLNTGGNVFRKRMVFLQ